MTYFNFLLRFLVSPIILLIIILWIDHQRGGAGKNFTPARVVLAAIGLHVLIAVIYTTPWDNYLVATGVWYYDPNLISGVLLGWVPLEEYTFFVLETIFVGLWWWFLFGKLLPADVFQASSRLRATATAFVAALWLWAATMLIFGGQAMNYLSLILVWALPPVMLQLAFGADILWHSRKLVFWTAAPIFLYISATDSLAIAAGTWTIDPAQSLNIFIGTLPVEEAVFFLMTIVIIVFGLTLLMAPAGRHRRVEWLARLFGNKGQMITG